MQDAALWYAKNGYSVIPLKPQGKKPLIDWAPYRQKKATKKEIISWWQKWPQANIGIVTGAVSGILVLDIDGWEGEQTIRYKGLFCPATMKSRTGGGGWHYIYRHPGFECKNYARQAGETLLRGLDFLGDGDYIVVPPSIHRSGNRYKWSVSPEEASPVAPPEWLLELIRSQFQDKKDPQAGEETGPETEESPVVVEKETLPDVEVEERPPLDEEGATLGLKNGDSSEVDEKRPAEVEEAIPSDIEEAPEKIVETPVEEILFKREEASPKVEADVPPGKSEDATLEDTPSEAEEEVSPYEEKQPPEEVEQVSTSTSEEFEKTVEERGTSPGFSEELRQYAVDVWEAFHLHPFVRGIGDGTLPLEQFKYWLKQDYVYLIDYARVFALAAAKAPDLETMGKFAALLDGTLNIEMNLHRDYAAQFGISRQELEATIKSPTTQAYTDFLLATSYNGDFSEVLAGLLPCTWGFFEIGTRLRQTGNTDKDNPYREWIIMYSSEDFGEFAAWIRDLMDCLGEEASPGHAHV